jgi:hypothetical protein
VVRLSECYAAYKLKPIGMGSLKGKARGDVMWKALINIEPRVGSHRRTLLDYTEIEMIIPPQPSLPVEVEVSPASPKDSKLLEKISHLERKVKELEE